jgi:hypothetical protein
VAAGRAAGGELGRRSAGGGGAGLGAGCARGGACAGCGAGRAGAGAGLGTVTWVLGWLGFGLAWLILAAGRSGTASSLTPAPPPASAAAVAPLRLPSARSPAPPPYGRARRGSRPGTRAASESGRPGRRRPPAPAAAAAQRPASAPRGTRAAARHARQLRRCGRRARRSSAEASPSASAESCGASRSHSAPDSIPARPLKNAFRPSVRAIDLGVAPRGQPTMRAASEPYHYGVVVRQIGRQSGSVAVSAMRRRPSAVWTPGIGLSA